MSRRYDQSTTTFSPEGRLHQVEYAMEAINNAGTCVGLQASDGIVLCAEKRTVSKLLAPSKTMEKTSVLDDHMVCLLAGLSADANTLIENIRVSAQRYLFKYQEPQPCEMLVKSICNYKQSYTQFGGLRPFGVAFILAGWDKHFGFQLYQSDPSGNYSGWKATVVGQNNQAGKSMLKTEYKDGATVASNTKLAIKILLRTMDSATPTPERIELSTLTCDENGKVKFSVIPQESIQSIIDEVKKEEEEEAKEKAASASDI